MDGFLDGIGVVLFLVILAAAILTIAGQWKTFAKAGQPGWACIVPIYGIIVLLEIVEKPLWWILLFFIPIVNLVIIIIVYMELAQRFGQSSAFGIGLLFLPLVFWPILGFGDAEYIDDL